MKKQLKTYRFCFSQVNKELVEQKGYSIEACFRKAVKQWKSQRLAPNPKTIFWEKMSKSLIWVMFVSIAPIFIWSGNWTVIPILLMGIWTGVVFFNHMKSLDHDQNP